MPITYPHYERKDRLFSAVVKGFEALAREHTQDETIDMDFSKYLEHDVLKGVNELWVAKDGDVMVGAIAIDYVLDAVDTRRKWNWMRKHFDDYGMGSRILGALGFLEHEEGIDVDKSAFIEFFALDSKYRHKGISARLYDRVERRLKRLEKTHLYFFTTAISKNTDHFLELTGFREKRIPFTTRFIKRLEGFKEFHLFERELEPLDGWTELKKSRFPAAPLPIGGPAPA